MSSPPESNFGYAPLVIGKLTADGIICDNLEIENLVIGEFILDGIVAAGNISVPTGKITAASLDTGQGANQLYDMDQNVRTTDAVEFVSIDTGQGANELYEMNQNVRTTDAVTFNTVDTGQGANELYAMDQNMRTTDSVEFVSLRGGELSAGGPSDDDAVITATSTTKGVLLTRQTTAQRLAFAGPPEALITYDTDIGSYFLYHDTTGWEPMTIPAIKGYTRIYFSSSVTVSSSPTIITTQYDAGSDTENGISLDTGTGEITLVEGRRYAVTANLLLQGFSTNSMLFFWRILNDSGAIINRAVPMVRNNGIRSDETYFLSYIVDTREDPDNTIIRMAFTNGGTSYSLNSNFCQFNIMEL